jgi:hypothetical protein
MIIKHVFLQTPWKYRNQNIFWVEYKYEYSRIVIGVIIAKDETIEISGANERNKKCAQNVTQNDERGDHLGSYAYVVG